MLRLGTLLHRNGSLDTARGWWVKAAAAGSADAILMLGTIVRDNHSTSGQMWGPDWLGDLVQAQQTFDRGRALEEQGDLLQAQQMYERAAQSGHVDAMYNLGAIAGRQGDTRGVRAWWNRAAAHGCQGTLGIAQ
jgi:TPR repeat protein